MNRLPNTFLHQMHPQQQFYWDAATGQVPKEHKDWGTKTLKLVVKSGDDRIRALENCLGGGLSKERSKPFILIQKIIL